MTPDDFIKKWRGVTLKESASTKEHFLDLCHLLGEPTPIEADPPRHLVHLRERHAQKRS